MVFTTACCTSGCKPPLLRALRWLIAGVFLVALGVRAAEIEVSSPQLHWQDGAYQLSADFSFELNSRLEEAVARGMVLYFLVEFELGKPRWYWLDEKILEKTQTLRLSYHALTRQYRVSSGGGLHQSFSSLNEALRVLSRLRYWVVAERGNEALRPGEAYQAALRLRLDLSQLPKPFQIVAVGNRDWTLASDWKRWRLTLPEGEGK